MTKNQSIEAEIINAFSEIIKNAKITRKEIPLEYSDHSKAGKSIQFIIRGGKDFEYQNGNVWQLQIKKNFKDEIEGILFFYGENESDCNFHIERDTESKKEELNEKENIDEEIKYKICLYRFEIKELDHHWKECPHKKDSKSLKISLLCRNCIAFKKDIDKEENRSIELVKKWKELITDGE